MNNDQNKSKRILVAEDEIDLRNLYVALISSEGYTVDFAVDGEDALNKMKLGGYDLVLLDIYMPKIDGIKVLEELIRVPPSNPNKSIVLLTNVVNESLVAQSLSLGIRGYLAKSSYTPDTLMTEVRKFLSPVIPG